MIVNRQSAVLVSAARLEKFLAKVERILLLPAGAVTVCLLSEAGIARLNRAFRRRRGSTDVLSFPADGRRRPRGKRGAAAFTGAGSPWFAAADCASELGEVAIAPAVARRNARRAGRPLEDELRLLILHGVLHLIGYDHETDCGEMDRRELRLRRKLGIV